MNILQQIPDNELPVLSLYEILGAGSEYDFHQLSPWLQSMPLGMEALQQLVPLHYVLQDSVDLLKTHHKETHNVLKEIQANTDFKIILSITSSLQNKMLSL